MPAEMKEKMAQKDCHLDTPNVPLLKVVIKPQMSSLGRNGKSRERRNPFPFVEVIQSRRLPLRSPSPAERRDEKETALIQKYQMGAKCGGFFLWPANDTSSNVRFLPRPVPGLSVPASGNSSPSLLTVARYGWDDTGLQKSFESLPPPVASSTVPSDSQQPLGPSRESQQVAVFLPLKAWEDALEPVCNLALFLLSVGRPVASETRSLPMSTLFLPPPIKSCPLLAIGWLGGDAFPIAEGFLEVSCPPV